MTDGRPLADVEVTEPIGFSKERTLTFKVDSMPAPIGATISKQAARELAEKLMRGVEQIDLEELAEGI